MNYKVVEFTLEYRRPERNYFSKVDLEGSVSMKKKRVENPFIAMKKEHCYFIDIKPKKLFQLRIRRRQSVKIMSYRSSCAITNTYLKSSTSVQKKPLLFCKNIDHYFSKLKKPHIETAENYISKKPVSFSACQFPKPCLTKHRPIATLFESNLIAQRFSTSSSSSTIYNNIFIQVNTKNIQGLERDIIKLHSLYEVHDFFEDSPWIVGINGEVGIVAKKCNKFPRCVLFKEEGSKSALEDKLFVLVKSLIRKLGTSG